jgi:hypothetical protein
MKKKPVQYFTIFGFYVHTDQALCWHVRGASLTTALMNLQKKFSGNEGGVRIVGIVEGTHYDLMPGTYTTSFNDLLDVLQEEEAEREEKQCDTPASQDAAGPLS